MKYKNRQIFTLVALALSWLWWVPDGMAQQYDFKRYSVAEGMPHSQVSTIHQDEKGFMWFGTMGGGLTRFNGDSYKTYTRSNGLRDNVVNAVFEDSTGRFWVSTDQGGVGILINDKVEYQFTATPLDTAAVYKITQSPDGRIWFGTYGAGIFIYDGENLEQLTVEDGLSSNFVWDFNFRKDGSVWMGTHNGLTIYNRSSVDETVGVQTITDTLIVGGYAIYDIFEGSGGKTWLATNNGAATYQNGDFSAIDRMDEVPLEYTYSIAEDRYGNIWIGTAENGLFRQFDDSTFHQVTTENGLSSNLVYTLYKDRNERMWVGTSEQGVNVYKGDTFVKYNGSSSVDEWAVLSVKFTSDHRLLVGTEGQGLWEIDYHPGKFSANQIGFEGEEIWVIEELANGHLLLLTGDNIIYEYNGNRVINYNEKIGLLPIPYTIDLFVDSNDNTWIGTNAGVYEALNDTLQHFDISDGLADNVVWEISEHNDSLWIATNDGLSVFADGVFNNITTQDGMAHDIVSTITRDEQQDFWIGTSGGISYLSSPFQDSLRFKNFDADSGLTFVDTQVLKDDGNGRLLQGTNAGLQILDITTYRQNGKMNVGHFPLGENNTNLEFAHKAVDTDSTGAIWMGTTTGLLRYEPTMFSVDSVGPNTEISTMQINFQDVVRLDDLSSSDKIMYDEEEQITELDHVQNNITFTFSALEYKDPTDVEYRYRLKGFNDRWSIARSAFAVFTNLPPKDYQFEVQAQNKYGYWGQTASFGFSIVPPFWQTYWFYALMLCLVVAAGYMFIKARVHYLEKRRLKVLVDEKTQDLQSALDEKVVLIKEVHHRVKNNLAVISGLLELQLGKTDSELAENVLKESQRRVLAISLIHEKLYQNERLSEIDFEKYVAELIDIITYSFSHIEKDVEVMVDIRGDIELNIDQSIPCGLIINELVSNAFEHAFEGKESGVIKVIFSRNGNWITLNVTDDGVGCTAFEETDRESLGITLIENLVIQLDGELEVESDLSGTSVVIRFENAGENYRY